MQDDNIPVTEPFREQYTQVAGASLEFVPVETEIGYALYAIDPPGPPQTLSATGEGPLWLLVADYGNDEWVMEPFVDGAAVIDLTELGNPFSEDGYLYGGVICPAGETGRLDALTLAYDGLNLTVTADDHSITLSWDETGAVSYLVYRSTLSSETAPYHVGTVAEEHTGGNSFSETVPEDESGRWVPENNDSGTPEDTSDDFPTIAPAVTYYYCVAPVWADRHYATTPEVSATVPWGDRNSDHRSWPDTTNQSRVFFMKYYPYQEEDELTTAQLEWMATKGIGSLNLSQQETDIVRAINLDYIVLGELWSHYANNQYYGFHSNIYGKPLCFGNTEDPDNYFPYLDRHEDWFIHHEDSTWHNQRVREYEDSNYIDTVWLDADSQYKDYLSANLLELLGENHFDGWVISECFPKYAQAQFWPGEGDEALNDYWRPKLLTMLTSLASASADHPRAPWIAADVYNWCINAPAMDYSPCDVIYVDNFAWLWQSNEFDRGRFPETADRCIDAQKKGQVVLVNENLIYESDVTCTYACYLMIRGPRAYFYNWGRGLAWYPEYEFDSGAPLQALPEAVDEFIHYDIYDQPYYRRDFENCFVVINCHASTRINLEPGPFQRFESLQGGPVDASGYVEVDWHWRSMNWEIPPGGWILRETPE